MAIKRTGALLLIIIIMCLGFLTSCGGGMRGTWVHANMVGDEQASRITFSGSRFTVVHYTYFDSHIFLMWRYIGRQYPLWFNAIGEHQLGSIVRKNGSQWRSVTASGTFSISEGIIELNFTDGGISVLSFTQTENTLTFNLDGWGQETAQRFIRR